MQRNSLPYLYKCPYCWRKFHSREPAVEHIKVSHSRRGTQKRRSSFSSESDGGESIMKSESSLFDGESHMQAY